MTRTALVIAALLSPLFFPLPFTIFLALVASLYVWLTPLGVGLIVDALYYTHGGAFLPLYSLLGLLASALAYFVHRFVKTSIMEG